MTTLPKPPFNPETVAQKVGLGEAAWNSSDPERISHVAITEAERTL